MNISNLIDNTEHKNKLADIVDSQNRRCIKFFQEIDAETIDLHNISYQYPYTETFSYATKEGDEYISFKVLSTLPINQTTMFSLNLACSLAREIKTHPNKLYSRPNIIFAKSIISLNNKYTEIIFKDIYFLLKSKGLARYKDTNFVLGDIKLDKSLLNKADQIIKKNRLINSIENLSSSSKAQNYKTIHKTNSIDIDHIIQSSFSLCSLYSDNNDNNLEFDKQDIEINNAKDINVNKINDIKNSNILATTDIAFDDIAIIINNIIDNIIDNSMKDTIEEVKANNSNIAEISANNSNILEETDDIKMEKAYPLESTSQAEAKSTSSNSFLDDISYPPFIDDIGDMKTLDDEFLANIQKLQLQPLQKRINNEKEINIDEIKTIINNYKTLIKHFYQYDNHWRFKHEDEAFDYLNSKRKLHKLFIDLAQSSVVTEIMQELDTYKSLLYKKNELIKISKQLEDIRYNIKAMIHKEEKRLNKDVVKHESEESHNDEANNIDLTKLSELKGVLDSMLSYNMLSSNLYRFFSLNYNELDNIHHIIDLLSRLIDEHEIEAEKLRKQRQNQTANEIIADACNLRSEMDKIHELLKELTGKNKNSKKIGKGFKFLS